MSGEIQAFRKRQNDLVALAARELRAFYATLNPDDGLATVAALEQFLPELIQAYGDIGAAVAAEFYEELRERSPATKAYRATMAEVVPLEQAKISTKWAVSPLFGNTDSVAALNNLLDVTDRLVKQTGRDTVIRNLSRDPSQARWARVPSGTETCTFCLMLASRGAEYLTEESASVKHRWHERCDCTPTPIWGDDDYARLKDEQGYDPDALYDKWQETLEAEQAAKENN